MDGHNSHYTCGFLKFAQSVWIHILCYAAHGAHVYQGLDVIIFAMLKLYWTQEKDRWKREKCEKIMKTNFLAIYGAVHKWALTPANMKMALRKQKFGPSTVIL